ncbi:MAG: hypothetical protein A3K10_03940 [Bacteroidetes bacterium RIFCSPLOWO2_12_FULL_31_6]|nr:MAG: hypothetical protein A3K10_03940 [Bacteroidetes bacterium RIFCSPLOWO2_12_FULL_31_6]
MKCPQCYSINIIKNGKLKNKQRYLCKQCATQFTSRTSIKPKNKLNLQKNHALILLLSGFSYRNIGEILSENHMTIYKWLLPYHHLLSKLIKPTTPEVFTMQTFFENGSENPNGLFINLKSGKVFIGHH